ncbi:MAG: LysR family transcriptional regulator, partial [Bacilli bacterium]|nr:LysR family transcriptional regulator [Bacilli bacterium]
MKTSLDLYKTFYYVARSGSITQAANELVISQPAVSKAIKVLESDLDTILFNRNKDGVTLTNAGELLFNKIKQSIELI